MLGPIHANARIINAIDFIGIPSEWNIVEPLNGDVGLVSFQSPKNPNWYMVATHDSASVIQQ